MELDDLKAAMARIDARLERQEAMQLDRVERETRGRVRERLRPLAGGLTFSILFGAAMCLLGIAAWHGDMAQPGGVFVSGIVMHVFGVLTIMVAVITKVRMAAIDEAGPVVEIQRRLAEVRRAYVTAGVVAGLSWAVLWVPAMIALFAVLLGVDISQGSPSTLLAIAAGCVPILLAPWLVLVWARATGRERIAAGVGDFFAGSALRRAREELDEVLRFARD